MKAIILAGGGGTRLWPISRKNSPKQARPFLDDDTLLQKTYKRALLKFKPEDIIISAGEAHFDLIHNQLPEVPRHQYILEPARKDTAAAIGLAAMKLHRHNPQEKLVIIYSDAYVGEVEKYIDTLNLVERVLDDYPKQTVLVGITPAGPETGYGYIKKGELAFQTGVQSVYRVERFVEKPDLETAKEYLAHGDFFWNPGMFAWQVDYLLELYQRNLPKMHEIFMKIERAIGSSEEYEVLKNEFSVIDPISIDYGILEKTKDILLVTADFKWSDVGNWKAIKDLLIKDADGNLIRGNVLNVDSRNCLLYNYSEKLLAVVGLENIIAVETEDAILVCPEGRAQEVKKIVEQLKNEGRGEYL